MAKEEEVASSNSKLLPAESWDFGKCSCEDAEEKLMAIGINKGQFIVRNDIYAGNIDGLCCIWTEACPKENPNTIGLGKDRWEMPKQLGQGHFIGVWEGVCNVHEHVAVGTLKLGTSADFLAEANVMKKFSHEHLVHHYAVCSDREPIYIVTELMSNGSLLDYLKDGTGKYTKLTTHVDMGAQTIQRGVRIAGDGSFFLDGHEIDSEEEGLNETEEDAASGEQDKFKGQNTSLPPANNNKTWTTKFGGIEHMYTWMLLYLILFGTFSSGSNGEVYVQREDFRKMIIATNETQIATDPILRRDDYLVYSVFATDGNDDRKGYECTPDFVSTNQSCRIVAGDRSKAECEGLQISMNGSYTYLAVDGSKLTYDRTTFCILQRVPLPGSSILYTLEVSKKQEQEDFDESSSCKGKDRTNDEMPVDVQRKDFRSITMATSETKVATDPVPKPVNGANYLIFARDENDPGNYKCTPEFVAVNQSCNIFMGDKNKTECEGLQISGNGTHVHLAVDGSKLTHEHTAFCILQQFPGLHFLYPLGVFTKHDQALETNCYEVAFYILLVILLVILLLIVIITLFLCIWVRCVKNKSLKRASMGVI